MNCCHASLFPNIASWLVLIGGKWRCIGDIQVFLPCHLPSCWEPHPLFSVRASTAENSIRRNLRCLRYLSSIFFLFWVLADIPPSCKGSLCSLIWWPLLWSSWLVLFMLFYPPHCPVYLSPPNSWCNFLLSLDSCRWCVYLLLEYMLHQGRNICPPCLATYFRCLK